MHRPSSSYIVGLEATSIETIQKLPASRGLKTVPWSNTFTIDYDRLSWLTCKRWWTLMIPAKSGFDQVSTGAIEIYTLKYMKYPTYLQTLCGWQFTQSDSNLTKRSIAAVPPPSQLAVQQRQERRQRLFLHVFDMWSRFRHLTFVNLWTFGIKKTPSSQTTKWLVVMRHVPKHFEAKRISSLGRRETSCCPSNEFHKRLEDLSPPETTDQLEAIGGDCLRVTPLSSSSSSSWTRNSKCIGKVGQK